MSKKIILASATFWALFSTATLLNAGPFQRPVWLYEDFSGYPPETTATRPDGYECIRNSVYEYNTQSFNYDLWDSDGIVRWRIGRTSNAGQRHLVYTGTNGVDPSMWSNYTVYTTFSIPTNTSSASVHLHARLQPGANELGYSANLVAVATGETLPNRLILRKNNFTANITEANHADIVIAYTEGTFIPGTNALYTLKFTVQDEYLAAWLYEGTNLLDPDALKLSISGTDTEYQTGTAGLGLRTSNTNGYGFFYNLKVEGPVPHGTAIIIR